MATTSFVVVVFFSRKINQSVTINANDMMQSLHPIQLDALLETPFLQSSAEYLRERGISKAGRLKTHTICILVYLDGQEHIKQW